MKLIVGLGNPGEKFQNTRHNVGFLIADRLQFTDYSDDEWEMSKKFQAVVCRPKAESVILAKPQTFMNESGSAVSALTSYFKIHTTNLYVIHDDLDIKLGEYKIQLGVGPKVHNGVNSIEEKLGTKDFWRVRVGIDNRNTAGPDGPMARRGEEYVLQNFTDQEKTILIRVIEDVARELFQKLVE